MTGSQNSSDDLSQGMQRVTVKSPSPELGARSPKSRNLQRWKELLEQVKNSPSAAAKLRAVRLLKEWKKRPENNEPDLYRDELELVTADERELVSKELTLAEIFQGVCLFIDVRTAEDNRSEGVRQYLRSKGINVTTDITQATHIIFKEGLRITFEKGRELNLPFVSSLWIDDCKKFKTLMDYKNYPARGLAKYEDPIMCKKIRRKRSMQPAENFVLRTPKRRRRVKTKVVIESPLVELNQNKTETPVRTSNVTIETPKTIEVTVNARTHTRVSTQIRENRKTVFYSSDEMEVCETRHEIFTFPVDKSRKKSRKTRNSSQIIVPDVIETENEPVKACEVQNPVKNPPVAAILGPINSTRLPNMRDQVPKFDDENISPIVIEVDPCPESQSSQPTSIFSQKRLTLLNEETKQVKKPIRKRKLFNPNKTPEDVDPNDNSTPPVPPTPALPDELSPVRITKKGSEQAFEVQSQALNRLKQSQHNPTASSKQTQTGRKSRKTFACTGLDNENRTLLKTCVKNISSSTSKCQIQSNVDKNVTHLIMQEPYNKTQKLLLGILHGVWILNVQYLKDCHEMNEWLPEETYEVRNYLDGISLSRAERQIFGTSYKMRLFTRLKFYVCPELRAGAQEITEFIELADGIVTNDVDEANFQIRDDLEESQDVEVQVTSNWITDSIGAGHCKNFRYFLVKRRLETQTQDTQGIELE